MDLSHLNQQQQEAATHIDGPLLILAGAGSGKTSTMTSRIAYLIEQGVSPYHILAVTFTNKAAGEMRERVERLVGSVNYMWIMTFHAMSLRILREHYDVVGYEKNFVVYDTVDQKTIIKNIMKEQNIDTKEYPQAYVSAIISKQKEADISPDEYAEINSANPKAKKISAIYTAYQQQLHANNAMDFDDLLINALHVLQWDKGALEDYRKRFQYIMVDEYQDTNHIQYELIKLLAQAHQNLCVVGDDDQCIYQWRGADISNILGFERDFPKAKVIKLEQNYRSYGNILAAAHSVIRNNHGRKEKKLWTTKEDGEKITYYRADTDKEEARYIAQEIYNLETKRGGGSLGLSGGADDGYNDFAVLYRTNAQSRLFEDAFKARGIPYQILSGFSFYERKETKDMICYLRLVVNPSDDLAIKRVINEPKRGVGPTTMAKLEGVARVNGLSLFDALCMDEVIYSLPAKASKAVKEMVDIIQLCQQERANLRVSDIYDNLMFKTGYMKALEETNTVEAESRIENLLDFKSFIYDFEKEKAEAGEEATLEEFLEKVATDSDTDKYDETAGKVTMMTMHSAKGLEFPVVFMPGMEDGLFPSHRAFDNEEGMEEERRLCYVGITRAKEKLYLTGAAYRVLYGRGDATRESTFMRELDKRLLMGDAVYEPSRRTSNRLGVQTGSMDGFAKPAYQPFGNSSSSATAGGATMGAAYDPLKYSRQASAATAAGSAGADFEIGDQVSHGKFGFGLVVDVDDKTVTVIFETVGQKRLAKGIAPIRKV
ncbi:MAG: UvrD-helicase domain-containing protein [Firmicutes bacterium]|nr:UvrD-helicase domain-containing protein [Bacillota bacterium]